MTIRDHPQDVTHWVTSTDGFNAYVFSAPVVIKGRWENKKELLRSDGVDNEFSKAVVYLDTDVAVGDYIAEGDHTLSPDPTVLLDSHEVKIFERIPDIRQLNYERKAIL